MCLSKSATTHTIYRYPTYKNRNPEIYFSIFEKLKVSTKLYMKLTAKELYTKLVSENNFIGQKGKITFELMDRNFAT